MLLPVILTMVLSDSSAQGPDSVPGELCDRPCGGPPLHCVFDWAVKDTNLSLAGHGRPVTAVEDLQLGGGGGPSVPGPAVFLCQGDTATVHLANHAARGTSVHWHGLYQRTSPWADGVPGVTQCPVQTGESFLWYDFRADQTGTFWYHSHSQFQRDDGLSGVLVVREQPEPGVCDLTEHVIHLQDLFLTPAEERYITKTEAPAALLVNGLGRINQEDYSLPWAVFNIEPRHCSAYRFRVVSAVTSYCPVILSVEGHLLTVVASDGQAVEPEEVASITLSNGERFDFIISTQGHEARSYTMTFAGSYSDWTECSGLAALAFLHYGAAPVDQSTVPDYQAAVAVPGRHLNPCPPLPVPEQQTAVPVSAMRAVDPLQYPQPADRTFYFVLGDGPHGANINFVQFPLVALEAGPPLLSEDPKPDGSFCSSSYTEDGMMCDPETDPTGCFCTHLLEVSLGDVVEIFLINPYHTRAVAHPIHLHGHHYTVLGEGAIPSDNPMTWLREQNDAGAIPRNLDRPPHKDSVQTWPAHYILISFLADNPGYWLLHCHISFDVVEGQAVVFRVGERDDWDLPADFNTNCGA